MEHINIIRLKKTLRPFHLTAKWYYGLAKSNSRIKRGISLIILGCIAFLSVLGLFQILDPYLLQDWSHLKLTLNTMGISGMLSYLLMVVVFPLFSPLTLVLVTGSAAFGPVKGFFLSYVGCIISANIIYALIKSLSIENKWGSGRRAVQVREIIKKHAYIIMIGLQLISVIPFTLISAAAVASGVPWKKFVRATSIGICPSILFCSFMGNELVVDLVSPRIYFAGVFVMVLLLVVMALRKTKKKWAAGRSRKNL
jgi:uncharacterized membrane protein YdjX (TVP38/TMEM64 family)